MTDLFSIESTGVPLGGAPQARSRNFVAEAGSAGVFHLSFSGQVQFSALRLLARTCVGGAQAAVGGRRQEFGHELV